ncbi:MAG: ABC transporter permease [Chloroflexi bacterium]|nr:ABC transporter permease [Chloroflexota bacterium]
MNIRTPSPAVGDTLIAPPSVWAVQRHKLWRFIVNKPLGAGGAAVVLVMLFLTVFGSYLTPYNPIDMRFDERLESPNPSHVLGTDPYGRDVFSNIIGGARISIYVGFAAVIVGTGFGGLWGLVSGYTGGRFDLISQRLIDILQSIPTLALALVIVASLGSSLNNVVIAISIGLIAIAARVVRGSAITIRNMNYVEAAVCSGASWRRVVFRHVLPNCMPPYLVVATAALGIAILQEASLSFLGVGVPPPHPSWGRMLSGIGRDYLLIAPWLSLAPGMAIVIVVMAFNLFGDALRDILDPRLRGTGRR